jgi:hypothetical protein
MWNVWFMVWVVLLFIVLLFGIFKEYKDNRHLERYLSPFKAHLWFLIFYSCFFNYLNAILYTKLSFLENLIGASLNLVLAMIIIFVYYPKMSKACLLFFMKRYSILLVVCFMSLMVKYGYLGILVVGAMEIILELYMLQRRKV